MHDLTLKEQKHVRVALRFLRVRLGGWASIAKVLRVQPNTLEKVCNGRRPVTASLALRTARFIEQPIDDLLEGRYTPVGTCPHCGRPPDFVDEDTMVEDQT